MNKTKKSKQHDDLADLEKFTAKGKRKVSKKIKATQVVKKAVVKKAVVKKAVVKKAVVKKAVAKKAVAKKAVAKKAVVKKDAVKKTKSIKVIKNTKKQENTKQIKKIKEAFSLVLSVLLDEKIKIVDLSQIKLIDIKTIIKNNKKIGVNK